MHLKCWSCNTFWNNISYFEDFWKKSVRFRARSFRFHCEQPDNRLYEQHTLLLILARISKNFLFYKQHLWLPFSVINLRLKTKIHSKEISFAVVPPYCIEKEVHIPSSKGHFTFTKLHFKGKQKSSHVSQYNFWLYILTLEAPVSRM